MSEVPAFKKGWILIFAVVLVGLAAYWMAESRQRPTAGETTHEDGPWKHTNRLVHETSPYLLLHAHNPVDWYPWGPEALERARKEDIPIFLSVGYSACYWCHVMERLVFSNAEIADLMNRWFINVKVDREERPDLDEIYMTATQIFTGHGGWPNSVFLTPELKPFFAGTYFPPEDDETLGRPGFRRVLQAMHEIWTTRRADVEAQAARVVQIISDLQPTRSAEADLSALDWTLVEKACALLYDAHDAEHGGFGGAPKFPPDQALLLLLDRYERTGDPKPLEIARQTLEKIYLGGIHDHLGGGFHRYATDSLWRVPHFEKMLYNQAHLAKVYLKAYRLTGESTFKRAAEGIFRFVDRVMTSPEGGFYSALDSQTDHVEGEYYVWTEAEIRQVLQGDADLFFAAYDLAPTSEGGKGVLFMPRSLEVSARAVGVRPDELSERMDRLEQTLLNARRARRSPLLDTKVVTAWNGMMIAAYAYGYEVLGKPDYLQAARRAAEFVLAHLRETDGTLMRTYREGRSSYEAYQEDYAFLAQGLLAIHRAAGEERYLQLAAALAEQMQDRFRDPEQGGFYFTADPAQLIVRIKKTTDGAIPSGNAEAVSLFLNLARQTGKQAYLKRAERTLLAFGDQLKTHPGFSNRMLQGLIAYLDHRTPQEASRPAVDLEAPRRLWTDEGRVAADIRLSTDRPFAGEPFEAVVTLQVAEGWHINANPVSLDFLVPTELSVASPMALDVISIEYPRGTDVALGFADQPLAVYDGIVPIRATLKLSTTTPPGSRGQIRLTVAYQACDDARCLPPASLTRRVELAVSP